MAGEQDHTGTAMGGAEDDSGGMPTSAWVVAVVCLAGMTGLVIASAGSQHRHFGSQGFVGPDACGECHKEQHQHYALKYTARKKTP